MNDDILTGILPVAPTVFTDDEDLDLDGQRRVVDFLVDAEADGSASSPTTRSSSRSPTRSATA